MKNYFVPRIFFTVLLIIFFPQALNADSTWSSAKEGNKIILIRHALAPGTGDPADFKVEDCSTQRNLNQVGIDQVKQVGSTCLCTQLRVKQYNANSLHVPLLLAWQVPKRT